MGHPQDAFYLVNLSRRGHEVQSQDLFRGLLRPEHRGHFQALTWEDLYTLTGFERQKISRPRVYRENKTLRLRQAFDLGRPWVA